VKERKKLFCAFFILLLFFVVLFPHISWSQEYREITVSGAADVVRGNEEQAKKSAVRDALRTAVEMAVGVVIQSSTDVKDFEVIKDEIKSNAEGYVKEYNIIKEGIRDNRYNVTLRAKVMTEKISEAFKKRVEKASQALGNPSITFVLTTWKKIGEKGGFESRTEQVDISASQRNRATIDGGIDEKSSANLKYSTNTRERSSENVDVGVQERAGAEYKASAKERQRASGRAAIRGKVGDDSAEVSGKAEASVSYDGQAKANYKGSYTGKGHAAYEGSSSDSGEASASQASSYRVKGAVDSSQAVDASSKVTKYASSEVRLSETEWKKFPDITIIDAFNQEFGEKNFDRKATDKARRIALAESLVSAHIDVFDRDQVRSEAEKEGANYVARGEVQLIDYRVSESTGKPVVTSKIGVEIIDVNSADIVASYSNTTKAAGTSREEAEAQAIKKIAVLAARELAKQTLETWEKRGAMGRFYTIEVRNITNIRKQQVPLLKVIRSIAEYRNHTNPTKNVLLVDVSFKGNKDKLGDAIIEKLDNDRLPGFSSDEFNGPTIEGGKIVFEFKK